MSITLRAKRILTGALAGALVLGLLPAGVASAATTACQGAASGTFTDSNPTHQGNIDCVAAYGVITGRADGTFGGSQNITRGQMATMIAKFAEVASGSALPVAAHTFTDVAGNVHADNIARIFGAGVTAGRTATTFAPNDTITRAEAATMLANAHVALGVNLSGVTPSTSFTDLGSSVHATNINILAGAGVVSGKTATTFAPSASILRAEAATLLVRSVTVLRSQNLWSAPPLVAPTTNQTFTVTSGDVVVASTDGTRDYTITGLNVGTQVRIQLLGTDAFNSDGSFVLTDTGDAGNRLAGLSTAGIGTAVITHVNGADVGNAATQLLTPASTTATFRVSVGANNDAAIPVVFETATANGTTLAVNLAGAPKKAYGVGGRVTFRNAAPTAPAEATTGAITQDAVTVVWPTGVEIANNTGLFVFRDHDVYQFGGTTITKSQFLSIVGVGDTLAATSYVNNSTAANPSTFNITTDVLNVATFQSTVASTTTLGQVTVRWTPGTQASLNGTTFNLQRRQVPTVNQAHGVAGVAGTAGEWSTVWTGTLASLSQQTFTETLTAGNYQYRVQSVAPAFSGTATQTTTDVTANATAAVTTTATVAVPNIRRVYLTQNATNINNLNSGDQFKVVFNQTVNQPAIGATLELWVAGNNTNALTLTNRAAGSTTLGSATFTVNTAAEVVDGVSHAAGRVLTVTLNANPDPGVAAFWTDDDELRIVSGTGIGNNAGNMPPQTANNAITRDVVS